MPRRLGALRRQDNREVVIGRKTGRESKNEVDIRRFGWVFGWAAGFSLASL